ERKGPKVKRDLVRPGLSNSSDSDEKLTGADII
ncbi:MAG: hypothetical protein ACJA0W_001505, partial [Candidatus Azotimanducaceae bacterium]